VRVKQITEEELIERIVDWVRANKQGSGDVEVSADSDLLGSGLLDSFGFLDLVVYIESQTSQKIDLAAGDPNEFSVVRGLSGLALRSGEEGI